MSKKKRTKQKKSSGTETKTRRAEKASKPKESDVQETASTEEEDEEEEQEVKEKPKAKEEKKEQKKEAPKKAVKEKEVSKKTAQLLQQAKTAFDAGRYRAARTQLVELLESGPTPEESEQAHEMLGNMEMDVRTLMVGAVAMVTILLIPTLGYANFAKALWTIPVLFLLLIVDPRLFRSPGRVDEN